MPDAALKTALWELIWAGWITGDTFAPVRAVLGGAGARKRSAPAHRSQRPPRLSRYSVAHAQSRPADPTVAGRWSILAAPSRIPRCAPTTRPSCCWAATAC